jgi:hypothetical protein
MHKEYKSLVLCHLLKREFSAFLLVSRPVQSKRTIVWRQNTEFYNVWQSQSVIMIVYIDMKQNVSSTDHWGNGAMKSLPFLTGLWPSIFAFVAFFRKLLCYARCDELKGSHYVYQLQESRST